MLIVDYLSVWYTCQAMNGRAYNKAMKHSIGTQRLSAQRVIGKQLSSPEEVVRWMGAIQAQDYGQAVWGIGVRMASATLAAIEQAIAEVKILRTWPMRGTIHFVPAEDAKWMVQLTAQRMLAADAYRQKQLGLDQAVIEQSRELFCDALKGGHILTRTAMMQLLESAGISTSGQRGYHILWAVAQNGTICLGPLDGKQQTFVLLDDFVPNARNLSREEALAELTKRYFTSHGPATIADFAGWTGLTLTEAKQGLESAKSALAPMRVDDKEYWQSHSAQEHADNSTVLLLPGFDEYFIGYKDRSAILTSEEAQKVVPGKNGIIFPIMVLGGRVIGTWKRVISPRKIDITFSPFTSLKGDAKQQALQAAEAYCKFIGLPLGSVNF
jgi:hypothetical protein